MALTYFLCTYYCHGKIYMFADVGQFIRIAENLTVYLHACNTCIAYVFMFVWMNVFMFVCILWITKSNYTTFYWWYTVMYFVKFVLMKQKNYEIKMAVIKKKTEIKNIKIKLFAENAFNFTWKLPTLFSVPCEICQPLLDVHSEALRMRRFVLID